MRRRAVEAARDRDFETLWVITEAHLGLMGQPSVHTLRAYRTGLSVALEALSGENVLRAKNWGLRFIRELETNLKASSVRSRLASARALFAALRWAALERYVQAAKLMVNGMKLARTSVLEKQWV